MSSLTTCTDCCIAFFDSISPQSQPHLLCSLLAEPLRTLAQTGYGFNAGLVKVSATRQTRRRQADSTWMDWTTLEQPAKGERHVLMLP